MVTWQAITWSAAAFAASISVCAAGPCTQEIEQMQARMDARLEVKVGTGPSVAESPNATMHRQRTPDSIAATEEKSGGLPPQRVEIVTQGMAQAGAADNAGDLAACEKALANVGCAINPLSVLEACAPAPQ